MILDKYNLLLTLRVFATSYAKFTVYFWCRLLDSIVKNALYTICIWVININKIRLIKILRNKYWLCYFIILFADNLF